MVLGNEVFTVLKDEFYLAEKSISSHWIEYLKDFNFQNDNSFVKRWEWNHSRTKVRMLLNFIFETPFRWQGKQFSEFKKILQCTDKFHKERGISLELGSLRQVLSLAFIKDKINFGQIKDTILVIGDGYGTMSSILLRHLSCQKIKVIVINLTKNLLLDVVSIKKSVPFANICLVKNSEDYHKALKDSEVNVICIQADNASLISNEAIGLAINIASMQEMNPPIIAKYFDFLRNSTNQKTYFYCCNRVEKILRDGTIVNYFKYPWRSNDQFIVDELCPWYQYYYNIRKPPFYSPYAGPIQHRLVLMNKNSQN